MCCVLIRRVLKRMSLPGAIELILRERGTLNDGGSLGPCLLLSIAGRGKERPCNGPQS